MGTHADVTSWLGDPRRDPAGLLRIAWYPSHTVYATAVRQFTAGRFSWIPSVYGPSAKSKVIVPAANRSGVMFNQKADDGRHGREAQSQRPRPA
jgi:hypothetical protein